PIDLGGPERVEVLEQVLHPRSPLARDLPHRLRERPRAGGVDNRVPLTGDLTEQREGNNALPGPWGSRDDDHGLAVTAAGFLDLVEHELVRHPLLVEEDELLTIADLGSGQVKELLGRLNARTEEVVRNVD